jgi:hypothetical protein
LDKEATDDGSSGTPRGTEGVPLDRFFALISAAIARPKTQPFAQPWAAPKEKPRGKSEEIFHVVP